MKSPLLEIKQAAFETAAEHILSHIDEYNIAELFLPANEKPLYQECAYILSRMPAHFIDVHAVEFLEWFQDLNWPGVDQIYDALIQLPKAVLTSALKKALEKAGKAPDEELAYNIREKFAEFI